MKNLYLALKDQMPLWRLIKNIFKGHILGLFHERSHQRHDGKEKLSYPTKDSAKRAAEKMAKKHGVYFSNYKCVYCDGYHIGKNRPEPMQ